MTMKKFIGLISAAVAATALTASAEMGVDIVSAYVWRGTTLSEEAQIQPGVETEILGGLASAGFWGSFDLDESQFIEVDWYVAVPVPLGEESPISMDVLYTEYTFPGVEGEADREVGVALGTSAAGVDFGFGAFYGFDGALDKTLYLEASAGYSMDLAENLTLDLGGVLHYWDSDGGESGFNAATVSAGLGVVIPEIEFPVSVGLSYVIEIDEDVAPVVEDLFFSVGFAL